ncbi:MAG: DUF1801 domain-containing protein [Saprospiraceae bacterium]|nr:DUF1801 domain-containing protein [Saprospiraceae bacterium]
MKKSSKMQNVSFQFLEEFLEFLPPDERAITDKLRNLVLDTLPEIKERLSFNVPYYRLKKDMCFIWPASVLWGKLKTYEGVRFGFTYGYLLQNETRYFQLGNRKQVTYRDFRSPREIDTENFKSFLFEAAIVDEQQAGNRKKKSS